MKLRGAAVTVCSICLVLALSAGCGRKLPPMPPGQEDPVEIVSIEFVEDGSVEARVRSSIEGAKISLLGKAKGLCPSCTDDLKEKDEVAAAEEETVILKDPKPESEYMVYRVSFEKGTTSFLTGARVVRK